MIARIRTFTEGLFSHVWALLSRVFRYLKAAPVTPIGWTLILGGLVSGWIGWQQGWLEFGALFIMAMIVIFLAFILTMGRREHQVLLELHRPRVQAGEDALGRVLVTASEGKATGPATLEFPVGQAIASFRVGALRANDEYEEMFTIPSRRRGIIPIGPVRSVQTDPVGAISRQRVLTESMELFIHPRIIHVEAGAVGLLKDIEGITTSNLSSSDVSFHALREYIPGDDRRAVHWRTTARTGKLMVRQFEEIRRAHLLILLSTLTADYDKDDDFELAVSVAGSLAASGLREERQVSLMTSRGELHFPDSLGMLDRLSGVELTDQGLPLRDLAAKTGTGSGISVACFVTGITGPAALRGAQLALPPGLRSFAIRCQESTELMRRKIGDLVILDIARLDDLRPAVRSLS